MRRENYKLMQKLRISPKEFKRRTDLVIDSMKERDLNAFIFWSSVSIFTFQVLRSFQQKGHCALFYLKTGQRRFSDLGWS